VSKASEGLREEMISDKKLSKPVDELDSHFKAWRHGLSSIRMAR
jgi:hypothetical protein